VTRGRFHFVKDVYGDWLGLYIDGRLVTDGHSLRPEEVATEVAVALGCTPGDVTEEEAEFEYLPLDLGKLDEEVAEYLSSRTAATEEQDSWKF